MQVETYNEQELKVKCKVCGNEMIPHFRVRGCLLYRCTDCSFEQVALEGSSRRIEYKAEYFESNKYRDEKALAREHRRRLSLLSKYSVEGSRILEFGCATGEFVNYVGSNFDIYGCDISDDAIRMAKEKYPSYADKFCVSGKILADEGKFDSIVLWDVIEHIEDPTGLIVKLREKIDDGYIIMSTPNIGALFAKISKESWPFMTPPEHLCFFSKKSMERMAKINGFRIEEWFSRGKWVNVGFMLYKFNRVSKVKIPNSIVKTFENGWLSNMRVYVPSHDIQYVVMKKM